MEEKEISDNIQIVFSNQNEFRMLAPKSVARGILAICDDKENADAIDVCASKIMTMITDSVPKKTLENITNAGKKTITEVPAYRAFFTDTMIKEFRAKFNELYAESAHAERMKKVDNFLRNYKPTISLGEALYRLSFYLIPNYNNLAKSTNCLLNFAKSMILDIRNNMLVDSAILKGGQGKSTVQTGLRRAAEKMGFAVAMCHLPTLQDGVQDVFVKNEVCIDDESHFERLDLDSLNKILDKGIVTIKGKYVKEWSAKSVANLLVGTNFLPTDVNTRRYSIRMVDENFNLVENYGRHGLPGIAGDDFGDSYWKVVEWVEEGWLNLFYYCSRYQIKEQQYKEMSFDYGLVYQIRKALTNQGTNISDINDLVRSLEQVSGDVFNWKVKQSYRNKLYMLATQLKLEIVGEKRHNMYNTYDWTAALEIDESFPEDPLERIYCYYTNNKDFNIKD